LNFFDDFELIKLMAGDVASLCFYFEQERVDLQIKNVAFRIYDFVLNAIKLDSKFRIERGSG